MTDAAPTQNPDLLTYLKQIAEAQTKIAASLAIMAAAAESNATNPRVRNSADHNAAMDSIFSGASTYAAVSRETGIPTSTLRGWPKIVEAIESIRGHIHRGTRTTDGDVDAWD